MFKTHCFERKGARKPSPTCGGGGGVIKTTEQVSLTKLINCLISTLEPLAILLFSTLIILVNTSK